MEFQTCKKVTIIDALMADILTIREERDKAICEKWKLHNKLTVERAKSKEHKAYRDAYIHAYVQEVVKNIDRERKCE